MVKVAKSSEMYLSLELQLMKASFAQPVQNAIQGKLAVGRTLLEIQMLARLQAGSQACGIQMLCPATVQQANTRRISRKQQADPEATEVKHARL